MRSATAEGSLLPFLYHYFSLVMLKCILEKTSDWASECGLGFFAVNELKTLCYLSKHFNMSYQDFSLLNQAL